MVASFDFLARWENSTTKWTNWLKPERSEEEQLGFCAVFIEDNMEFAREMHKNIFEVNGTYIQG